MGQSTSWARGKHVANSSVQLLTAYFFVY